ncbi:MAG: hypothetical protein O7C98_14665 [Planctomycetota bacterium]|nr:hypothetical protein [Planctomycetota bacterium]
MRRRPALLLVCAAGLAAAAGAPEARAADRPRSVLDRWQRADAAERRRFQRRLATTGHRALLAQAAPVLIELDGRRLSLRSLDQEILEPALNVPLSPGPSGPVPGEVHLTALSALQKLRAAYAPPQPVSAANLNLLLLYADECLTRRVLPPEERLRFFAETVKTVQVVVERVEPDALTRWLIRERLLPSLLSLSVRRGADARTADALSEAASLLYLPTLLDEEAQAQLAPLTRGTHALNLLLRAYGRGRLTGGGLSALVRAVEGKITDDAAFAASSAPLLLELLCDPRLSDRQRGRLVDVVLELPRRMEPLRGTARELLSAAFGGPARTFEEYARLRRDRPASLPPPRSDRALRFLRVVLASSPAGGPPVLAEVTRADLPLYTSLYVGDGTRARFVGVLLPAADGEALEFLGMPPSAGGRDNRLVRRVLRGERISIQTYGPKRERVELCLALPADASDPVPLAGGNLGHVLDLIEARLRLTSSVDERRDLVRLLVGVPTRRARDAAVRHAHRAPVAAELVPLAEGGVDSALERLMEHFVELDLRTRERVLVSALHGRYPKHRLALQRVCRTAPSDVAALTAEALLEAGDSTGVQALLQRKSVYDRASGCALSLRLTRLAGPLRVKLKQGPVEDEVLQAAAGAITKKDGALWADFGKWVLNAIRDPSTVVKERRDHAELWLGRDRVTPQKWVAHYTQVVADGTVPDKMVRQLIHHLLGATDPGRGIPPAELGRVLDAIEKRLRTPELERWWMDHLVIAACSQYALDDPDGILGLTHARFGRLAGKDAPEGAEREPTLLWTAWVGARRER